VRLVLVERLGVDKRQPINQRSSRASLRFCSEFVARCEDLSRGRSRWRVDNDESLQKEFDAAILTLFRPDAMRTRGN